MKRKHEISLNLVELEDDNFHITVESKSSDNVAMLWTLDTGASKSVFDIKKDKYFDEIEISPDSQANSAGIGADLIETSIGVMKSFFFGDLEIKDMGVALLDFNPINKIYEQFADVKISGLLGSDVLYKYKAKIDYKKLTLTLYG